MNPFHNTVFLVDDDPSVRQGVSRLLHSAGYAVTSFNSAEEFLAIKNSRVQGCLLLDLKMPGLNGLELQKALTKAGLLIPIVFITGHGDIPSSVRAMKEGAVDFLTKPFDQKTLLSAISRAMEKDHLDFKERSEQKTLQNRVHGLTTRERQVLTHVVAGLLNKQTAQKLGISEKTVKVHRARVMKKMHADSLAELVRIAAKIRRTNLPN